MKNALGMLTVALGLTLSSTASFGQSICPDPDARGEHWTLYGQTRLDPKVAHLHNPTPISGLVYGEVAALPYTVPQGKVLLINRVSLEAHWGTVLWPWVGTGEFEWQKVIETFRGRELDEPGASYEWVTDFYLPAGSVLNITLHPRNQPKSNPKAMRQGWGLSGRLIDETLLACDR
jgi:hypothetical protein